MAIVFSFFVLSMICLGFWLMSIYACVQDNKYVVLAIFGVVCLILGILWNNGSIAPEVRTYEGTYPIMEVDGAYIHTAKMNKNFDRTFVYVLKDSEFYEQENLDRIEIIQTEADPYIEEYTITRKFLFLKETAKCGKIYLNGE